VNEQESVLTIVVVVMGWDYETISVERRP